MILTIAMMLATQGAPDAVITIPAGRKVDAARLPAPAPRANRPVIPRSRPQGWFIGDDYPYRLRRQHLTGTTGLETEIDATGRVTACRITAPSGVEQLDAQACSLIKRRARFYPATDAAGVATASRWTAEFRWDFGDTPVALGSWARVTRFVINADGGVQDCQVANYGRVPRPKHDLCLYPERNWLQRMHGPGNQLVTVSYVETNQVEGMPMPRRFMAPRGSVLMERESVFDVTVDGMVAGCVSNSSFLDQRPRWFDNYDCHPGLRYVMPAGSAGAKATYSVSAISDVKGLRRLDSFPVY